MLILPVVGAEPDPLAGYKTVKEAATTKVGDLPRGNRVAGFLGVQVEKVAEGLKIIEIESGSPAEQAGLKVGDLARSLDGKPVQAVDEFRDLLRTLGAGQKLALSVQRGKETLTVEATLAPTSKPITSATQRVLLGIQGEPLDTGGLKVTQVTQGGNASRAGFKTGDVLLKIEKQAINSLAELATLLGTYKAGDRATAVVQREGKNLDLAITFAAAGGRFGGRPQGWDTRQSRVFKGDVYKLAVVCVEFPDSEHNAKISAKNWEEHLFSKGTYTRTSATGETVYGSMNDYYHEQSSGKFRVEGKVFDWVKAKRNRMEYASDSNRTALLTEACDKLLARDGAGALKGFDGIFFVYAGDRARVSRGGLYWPHKANFNHNGRSWSYFICPEGGNRMYSISTITHEFGHMLGLPDLYAKPEVPEMEGVGGWCTMSTGHGRDGKPLHFSAWCKEQLGWITPSVLDPRTKQRLILSPIVGSPTECYKVLLRPDGSEYLLLENRVRKGYDRDLPGEGLLIWRVLNGKVSLEAAHGNVTPDRAVRYLDAVPFPSKANTAFTPDTLPSSRSPLGGGFPVHITNIRKLPDGRITFWIGYEVL